MHTHTHKHNFHNVWTALRGVERNPHPSLIIVCIIGDRGLVENTVYHCSVAEQTLLKHSNSGAAFKLPSSTKRLSSVVANTLHIYMRQARKSQGKTSDKKGKVSECLVESFDFCLMMMDNKRALWEL